MKHIAKKGVSHMNKYDFFWKTMELCNWDKEGDDELVLMPVINFLASKEDADIFKFEDLMAELLFALDTKVLAKQCENVSGYFSDDEFLYSRCVALINGEDFYEKALLGKRKDIWDMEFESLLYVPMIAWACKHQKDEEEYPHTPPFDYETGSNKDAWSH